MICFAYSFFLGFTPLLLLYSVIGINSAPQRWRKYLPWLILAIGMISYGMQSKAEIDLDRYFQEATEVGRLPFYEIFSYKGSHGEYEGLWVITVLFWIVGRLGVVHLLPMIAGCIVYGVAFYITCDVAEEYNVQSTIPAVIAIQGCMLPFFSIISNVRNVTAFSLIVLAVYLDTVKKKRNPFVLILYILPVFIHSSAIILVLLRIGLLLTVKAKVLFLAIVSLLPILIDTLYTYIDSIPFGGSFGAVLRLLILKGYWYLHDKNDSVWARQVGSSKYQQLNRLVMIAFAVFVIYLICFKTFKHIKEKHKKIVSYTFLLSILTLSCSWFTTPHYWRFSAASVVSMGAVLVLLFMEKRAGESSLKLSKILVFIFAVLGVLLQIWPMQYNVDFSGWFENILLNNFYVIVFTIIRGAFCA